MLARYNKLLKKYGLTLPSFCFYSLALALAVYVAIKMTMAWLFVATNF